MSSLRLAKSADDGKTWTAPVTIASDSAFGTRNFHALHVGGDGAVYVAWLESSQGKSKTFLTRSTDAGTTWTHARAWRTRAQSCPCCRTAIATGARRHAVPRLADRAARATCATSSSRGRPIDGATWATPVRVHADNWVFDGCPHAGPSMQVDSAGAVHIAWWTGKQGAAGTYYARSTDGGETFELAGPARRRRVLGAGARAARVRAGRRPSSPCGTTAR